MLAIPGNSRGLIMNRDAISEILVPCMRQRHTLPSGIVEERVRSGRRISDVKQPSAVKAITDVLRARSQTKNKEDNKENAKPARAISYYVETTIQPLPLSQLASWKASCVH